MLISFLMGAPMSASYQGRRYRPSPRPCWAVYLLYQPRCRLSVPILQIRLTSTETMYFLGNGGVGPQSAFLC